MSAYEPSIGMEVHAELLTESKMFCSCANRFGGDPNTRCCPVCLGLPGALPVMNRQAVEHVARAALALNCDISMISHFHRKNYFYPDLPKNYQISQYGDTPIGRNGYLDINVNGVTRRIHITRIHLEEDTGKLFHLPSGESAVDYNRSGVPLMEIVTDFPPDIHSAEEAREYLVRLRQILVWLGVTDGRMEEGSLRCEPNVSVRPAGADRYGTKTELKNLNSFRSVARGVAYEIERHIAVYNDGGTVVQETRGWNEERGESFTMRSKEHEQDYRYFPDPDLVPVQFSDGWLDALRASMPEMPDARAQRYQTTWGLSPADARLLVEDRSTSDFFEACVGLGAPAQGVANWMNGELLRLLNADQVALADTRLTPQALADVIGLVSAGTITGASAKQVFEQTLRTGETPAEVVKVRGLAAIQDASVVESLVDQALADNPDAVQKVQSGKLQAIKFLVGQVMKLARGRASASEVEQMIRQRLGVSE